MIYTTLLDGVGRARADAVLRDDGAMIPADPGNADWHAYQAWRKAGNALAPASTPSPVVPTQVPMWAIQAALQAAGKYAAVNDKVAGWQSSSDEARVAAYFAWTMGNYATRSSSFIATVASEFGFSANDLDALFTAANAIAGSAG